MGDRTTIDQVAEELVDEYGQNAVDCCGPGPRPPRRSTTRVAAETWHKAADAAERKLRDMPGTKIGL